MSNVIKMLLWKQKSTHSNNAKTYLLGNVVLKNRVEFEDRVLEIAVNARLCAVWGKRAKTDPIRPKKTDTKQTIQ